jgi:hypothetical protein
MPMAAIVAVPNQTNIALLQQYTEVQSVIAKL